MDNDKSKRGVLIILMYYDIDYIIVCIIDTMSIDVLNYLMSIDVLNIICIDIVRYSESIL